MILKSSFCIFVLHCVLPTMESEMKCIRYVTSINFLVKNNKELNLAITMHYLRISFHDSCKKRSLYHFSRDILTQLTPMHYCNISNQILTTFRSTEFTTPFGNKSSIAKKVTHWTRYFYRGQTPGTGQVSEKYFTVSFSVSRKRNCHIRMVFELNLTNL